MNKGKLVKKIINLIKDKQINDKELRLYNILYDLEKETYEKYIRRMKLMNSMNEQPPNMTRVLLVSNGGINLSFGFYRDGMFKEEKSNKWHPPDRYEGWMSIKEVKYKLNID